MQLIINETDSIYVARDEAIAHGCNTRGIMGTGAAYALKERFGLEMFVEYRTACELETFQPGDVMVYHSHEDTSTLYNLAIQGKPGKHAKMTHVQTTLAKLREILLKEHTKTLAITPLGTRNGGLDYDEVVSEIEKAFAGADITVTIYSRKHQERIDRIFSLIAEN